MKSKIISIIVSVFACFAIFAQSDSQPAEVFFSKFQPVKAPQPKQLLLKKGDRLAICGDSITEQKMYSRLIEDYLTMCVPELKITVRQFGMGSETTSGFLARMTNDCLRFDPTIATTCYGMNDFAGRPYDEQIGARYRANSMAIVESFKNHGARVIQGSPGCVGLEHQWAKGTASSAERNLSLCSLRNIGIEIAQQEKVGYADVFWSMLTTGFEGRKQFGANYLIAGGDGVHPNWAGHAVMTYAFLKSFGLDGNIGAFSLDLRRNRLKVSPGHRVISSRDGEFVIESSRYPFCACAPSVLQPATFRPSFPDCATDDPSQSDSIRSAFGFIPFNQELNRLTLVVKDAKEKSYTVIWGNNHKNFSGDQLIKGINLTEEFLENPFDEAFARVDAAVAIKQKYETTQIKELFRSPEAKADPAGVAAKTEIEHAALAAAIMKAFKPVTYTLKIIPD